MPHKKKNVEHSAIKMATYNKLAPERLLDHPGETLGPCDRPNHSSHLSTHTETYSFLREQLAGLLNICSSFNPDVRVVTEAEQTLLIGKHHCNTHKTTSSVVTSSHTTTKHT